MVPQCSISQLFTCFVCMTILGLSSCSSHKNLNRGPIPVRSKAEIWGSLQKRNVDFTRLFAKAKVDVTTPDESISGRMDLRVVRDSFLMAGFSKLGFEAARVYLDPKQYIILYRFESVYEQRPLERLIRQYNIPFNYDDIQQFIVGNVIIPDSNTTTLFLDSLHYKLEFKDNGLSFKYIIDPFDLMVTEVNISDNNEYISVIKLDDYKEIPNFGILPFSRDMEFSSSKEGKVSAQFVFSEIIIDASKEIKFSIPENYERLR